MANRKKEWNKRNPEKKAAAQKRYYARGNKSPVNRNRRWELKDELLILSSSKTDRELAAILGRSVQAIQVHRSHLRNEE